MVKMSDNRLLKFDRWFLAPWRIGKVPFTGSWFYISAKFDQTTIERFIEAFLLSFIDPIIAIIGEIYKERANGTGNDNCMGLKDGKHFPRSACKQGANVIDFAGTVLGVLVYVFFIERNF